MDRIQAMRLFVRVAETRSFTKAADTMNMSRPAVSTLIQQLEARLDTRLLSRSTRHVELTPDGVAYYDRCVRLLADLDESDTLFQQSGVQAKGKLRVDVPSRVARLVIAPALQGFLDRHPEVEIELGARDRSVDLIRDGVDCVVRVGAPRDPRLSARRLGVLRMCNCASPSYIARHGEPRSIEDLAHHFVVHYAPSSGVATDDWEYWEQGERKTLSMKGRVTVDNAESYVACAIAGAGLIQVPAYDVVGHLSSGELVEVLSEHLAAPTPISILYPRTRHLSRRVVVFLEWVEELFKDRLMVGQ